MENNSGLAQRSILEQVQHHHFTQVLDGLLPHSINPRTLKDVLDLKCHTGTWAIDLALAFPGIMITGLDRDAQAVQQARQSAAASKLDAVHFYQTDYEQPLKLADSAFDFIHLLIYQPLVHPAKWPFLLAECQRVMKPGASINLINFRLGPGSSHAYHRLLTASYHLLDALGYDFLEVPGTSSAGIYFCRLLQQAQFNDVTYDIRPVNLGGWNNPSGRACCQLYLNDAIRNKHVFMQYNVISSQEFDELTAQMQQDIVDVDFCGTGALISASATRK